MISEAGLGQQPSHKLGLWFLWCDGDVIKYTPSHDGSHCTFPWCKTRIDWTTRRGAGCKWQKTKLTWARCSQIMLAKYQKTLTRKSQDRGRQKESEDRARSGSKTICHCFLPFRDCGGMTAWWHPELVLISIFVLFRPRLAKPIITVWS